MFYNGLYDERGLGDAATTVGTVGRIGGTAGSLAAGAGALAGAGSSLAAFGAIAGPIGAIVGVVSGIIAGILGQHAQKVAVENKISGQWAAQGPQAISQVVGAWQQGQISGDDATSALDSIYQQFLQMNQSITKYQGKTGAYPDPNAPRPAKDCNWACGTSYDLAQEIQGLKSQIAGAPVGAGGLTGNPLLLLGGAAVLLLLLLKR